MVEAIAVVVEASFDVKVLCRESMAEEIGKRTGLRNDLPEDVVGVLRDGVSIRIEVANDVTDIIVTGNEWYTIDGEV